MVGGVITTSTRGVQASQDVTSTAYLFLQRTDLFKGVNFFDVQVLGTDRPSPRTDPAVAFDDVSKSIFVFGGEDLLTGQVLSDTWRFDVAASTWHRLDFDLPQAAAGGKAEVYYSSAITPTINSANAFDNGLKIIMIGGLDAQGKPLSEDGYIFDGSIYEPVEVPPIRYDLFIPLLKR